VASLAWSGTGKLHMRVTLDDDTNDLEDSVFEGSANFQIRTSHTCISDYLNGFPLLTLKEVKGREGELCT